MIPVLDHSEDANLANKMWGNAYERDGFRYFRCDIHGYSDRSCLTAPATACDQCWWIYYYHLAAFLPTEELRQKFLDKGVQAVADAVQEEQAGKFDYQPTDHPTIHITLTDDA